MSRIAEAFSRLKKEGRRGFIPFITAGDPDLRRTRELLVELGRRGGATVIELGVPFSDPMADGPVIQRASERALRHGFGLGEILETVAEARKRMDVPVVLFSYFNPLLQFGLDRLCDEGARAGIDGVLATDLAPEEASEFSAKLSARGLDLIFLVAPTSTPERLRMIAERASGFIYAVSRAGVTGARADVSQDAARLVARVREVSGLPVAVGFGISNAEQVAEVWRYADAVVVGSALVAEIERLDGAPDTTQRVGDFARRLLPYEAGREEDV
ncbi:MAG: tryptophan synthase subunit alpha [Pyrinomonadaceae bacterium]